MSRVPDDAAQCDTAAPESSPPAVPKLDRLIVVTLARSTWHDRFRPVVASDPADLFTLPGHEAPEDTEGGAA